MDDKNSVKLKRAYDNTKRSSEAVYARKETGAHQTNGVDPARLQTLFGLDSCKCALFAHSSLSSQHMIH